MGLLKILKENGEKQYAWNPQSPQEVRSARETFDRYIKEGFIACKIADQGKRGMRLSEFDPDAEEIFMLGLADGG